MAISQTDGTSYLSRTTGTFPDNTGDWTVLLSFKWIGAAPANSREAFSLWKTTEDFVNPYLYLGSTPATSDIKIYADALADSGASEQRTTAATIVADTWNVAAVTYNHTTHAISLYVAATLIGSITLDLSAVAWNIFTLLSDSGGEATNVAVAYCRAWSSVLTPTQMSAEAASKTAVLASGLLWDYALFHASVLTDLSNQQSALTTVGSLGYIEGPLALTATNEYVAPVSAERPVNRIMRVQRTA